MQSISLRANREKKSNTQKWRSSVETSVSTNKAVLRRWSAVSLHRGNVYLLKASNEATRTSLGTMARNALPAFDRTSGAVTDPVTKKTLLSRLWFNFSVIFDSFLTLKTRMCSNCRYGTMLWYMV